MPNALSKDRSSLCLFSFADVPAAARSVSVKSSVTIDQKKRGVDDRPRPSSQSPAFIRSRNTRSSIRRRRSNLSASL
jgi:hypothetical protein